MYLLIFLVYFHYKVREQTLHELEVTDGIALVNAFGAKIQSVVNAWFIQTQFFKQFIIPVLWDFCALNWLALFISSEPERLGSKPLIQENVSFEFGSTYAQLNFYSFYWSLLSYQLISSVSQLTDWIEVAHLVNQISQFTLLLTNSIHLVL